MVFTRIRINPMTLVVDVADRSFAIFTNSTDTTCLQTTPDCQQSIYPTVVSYAVARSCMPLDTSSGEANVDLRETPFHIAGTDTSMFTAEGPGGGDGTVTLGTARKIADVRGGGDCGGFGAGAGLALEQDP